MIAERKEKSATISLLQDGTVSLGNLLGRWKRKSKTSSPDWGGGVVFPPKRFISSGQRIISQADEESPECVSSEDASRPHSISCQMPPLHPPLCTSDANIQIAATVNAFEI